MSFIRTVLGDIAPESLGFCYSHEHVIIDASFGTHTHPDFLHESVDLAVTELQAFFAAGGRAMVDALPCDNGRNVGKLAAISERSGVHLIASTGLHLEKYYEPGHWCRKYSREDLADLFFAEIERGIDANDYNGPLVQRTTYRAGVIKVASGGEKLTGNERRIFGAAADAHRLTGCPILTHTEQGAAALEQIELLAGEGAELRHVIISHTDRKPDMGYQREILRTGVKVEYDSGFRWRGGNPTFDLALALQREFPSQILLGMDAARRSYWKAYGGEPGMNFLIEVFVPGLRKCGMTAADVERIFVHNPAEAFSFAHSARGAHR
jgi:predicted metal-dependent phosphotriesterase family hydrolase